MAVTIVRNYWQYPWLGLLRAICISGVFIFTSVLFVHQNAEQSLQFPTDVPPANETTSLMFMPAACFQSGDSPAGKTIKESTRTAEQFGHVLMHSDPGNRIHGNLYIITLIFFMAALLVGCFRFVRRGRQRPRMEVQSRKKPLAPAAPPPESEEVDGWFVPDICHGGNHNQCSLDSQCWELHFRSAVMGVQFRMDSQGKWRES